MKAWSDQLDPAKETGVGHPLLMTMSVSRLTHLQIRFLGDPTAQFTKALDLEFDGSKTFGGVRGKRYALVVEDGKVKEAFVEPDNTGTNGETQAARSIKNLPRN
jgi:peroxiredoxin